MTAPSTTATDELAAVLDRLRPELADRAQPIKKRIRLFWVAAKVSRKLAPAEVVTAAFARLARETGLMSDLGRYGAEDTEHVIRWAMNGKNPL